MHNLQEQFDGFQFLIKDLCQKLLQHKLEQSMWKSQWLIKKEVEFPGVLMKKSCEFSWVLVFDLETSKGCRTILQNFQGWKLFFSGISKVKVANLKVPGGFFRKVYPQPPCSEHFPYYTKSCNTNWNKRLNQTKDERKGVI